MGKRKPNFKKQIDKECKSRIADLEKFVINDSIFGKLNYLKDLHKKKYNRRHCIKVFNDASNNENKQEEILSYCRELGYKAYFNLSEDQQYEVGFKLHCSYMKSIQSDIEEARRLVPYIRTKFVADRTDNEILKAFYYPHTLVELETGYKVSKKILTDVINTLQHQPESEEVTRERIEVTEALEILKKMKEVVIKEWEYFCPLDSFNDDREYREMAIKNKIIRKYIFPAVEEKFGMGKNKGRVRGYLA